MTAKRMNFLRNKTSATAEDVARWLLGELTLEGPLDSRPRSIYLR
jgi:hypothetical protein